MGIEPTTFPLFFFPTSTFDAGQNFTILLDATKTRLIVFGDNKFGQLSISGEEATITEPKIVPVGRSIQSLDCGWTHFLLLTSEGELWSAGRNNYGQLGR